ncbi:MAG: VWA domain-containing protein [Spirochaetales bacterium]|nr:VWA domain-containing protein [Spirochaetales bacterium]
MPVRQQKESTPKIRGVADIVICLDITGSMGPCINGVKNNLKSFIDNLTTGNSNNPLEWKAMAVGYRDVTDSKAPAFEGFQNSFTDNESELKDQIDSFEAAGGGDEPESLLDALYKIATEISWPHEIGKSHRIVVVFTDATCREELDSSTTQGDRSYNKIIDEYSRGHFKLFLFGINSKIYQSICEKIPKSVFFPQGTTYKEVIANLQKTGFEKVMAQLGKSVSGASDILTEEVLDAGSGGIPMDDIS